MIITDRLYTMFDEAFGPARDRELLAVHAPARSEIAGNHTDHEGGHVIAGALDVAICGLAAANGTDRIRVMSEGYPSFEVSVTDLEPHPEEQVSPSALVRGMAADLAKTGREPQGFDLVLTSTIPVGGGLSSSAAMEAGLGRVMEALWKGPEIGAADLAHMGQRAENVFFGKPCGLMDQLAVCLGGLAFMDFERADEPMSSKLDFEFEEHGFSLCLIDVGCDHSRFTADYAAVPAEMQQVAQRFDAQRLCEVDPAEFDARVGEVRQELGDRAVLRAIHYWYENSLVDRRWEALQRGDTDAFLALTRASGASSAMFLQNVSTGDRFQPAMLALGLAERILDGRGAARIHGGGFGGSIQAFVPLDVLETFIDRMDGWLGDGACRRYAITQEGASATWL